MAQGNGSNFSRFMIIIMCVDNYYDVHKARRPKYEFEPNQLFNIIKCLIPYPVCRVYICVLTATWQLENKGHQNISLLPDPMLCIPTMAGSCAVCSLEDEICISQ